MTMGPALVVKCKAEEVHIQHGEQYTYLAEGRWDGCFGGIKEIKVCSSGLVEKGCKYFSSFSLALF